MTTDYRFSFGPWNISPGTDPFGPAVRRDVEFSKKLQLYQQLGFDAVQLHDDDAVPQIDEKTQQGLEREASELRRVLEDLGLVAEFVAPRLWEDPRGVDGGFTSNNADSRKWAIERSKRTIDVANQLGTRLIVLWFAREGTYIREAKCAQTAYRRLLDAVNELLEYDKQIEIAIEPKPNEPMDNAYVPTIGHAIALAHCSNDPQRVGGLIETAHAQLAELDPSADSSCIVNSRGSMPRYNLDHLQVASIRLRLALSGRSTWVNKTCSCGISNMAGS